MFTIEQIKTAHAKVRSGADYPRFVQDIIALGVTHYTTFINDGHTDYKGKGGYQASSGPRSESLIVAEKSDAVNFGKHLKDHQAGKTDYMGFCIHCADDGIEKWTVDLEKMTCTYFDTGGSVILVEEIPTHTENKVG